MLKKIYIWNDLFLIKKNYNSKLIDKKILEIKKKLGNSISFINNKTFNNFKKNINKLDNIVVIGTRPNLFTTKIKYNINSKRIINKDGFAIDCKIDIDDEVYKMKKINIVEDIIVSGTTISKILELLQKKNKIQEINIYFFIGYETTINDLKKHYKNINIYCFNILKETPKTESTCIFLSDLLYEKLGKITYIEHVRNKNIFGNKTEYFLSKIEELKDFLKLKVGIVTITLGINYGNRLQNYALQETLNKIGVNSQTFENIYQEKKIINKIKRYFTLKKKEKQFALKLKRFDEFNKEYINLKGTIKSNYVSKNINKKFDYFICGSDQIWNPYYVGNRGTNFLTFAQKPKTISYAASFGASDILDDRKLEFKKYLEHINCLSCREEQGIKIIKDLTGRDAQLVLDPTLLLSKSEWKKISKKPKYIPQKKYLVTYFLGNLNEDYRQRIKDIAKKNNLEVFNIMDISDIDKFSTNPSEFIYLIQNAELICTDSFHGNVFSIIFNKPYIIFERNDNITNMNSRFVSLNNILKLPNRNYKSIKKEEIFNMDYTLINQNIEKEKEKSIEYLKKSLKL